MLEVEGVEVVEDSIGRPAIACEDAARLIGARRAAVAYGEAERARQMAEFAARYPVPAGIPVVEGMDAAGQMFAAWAPADRGPSAAEEMMDEHFARGRGG